MLVEIKPGTNVPTDKLVVAVSKCGDAMVGQLHESALTNTWICYEDQTSAELWNITHFVTIENLLKTR